MSAKIYSTDIIILNISKARKKGIEMRGKESNDVKMR